MDKKNMILIVVAIAAIALAATWYFATPPSTPQAPNQATEEVRLAEDIVQDWQTISAKIQIQAGESGRWYINTIRVIGSDSALVAFEDGLNGHSAAISQSASGYEIEQLYEGRLQFSAEELAAIQSDHGQSSRAAADFSLDQNRNPVRDTSNPFLMSANATMMVKIAWLDTTNTMPNEVKPGDINGCDHVVLQERVVARTQAPLTAALNELLSDKTNSTAGPGLYNYIANGNLKLDSVVITDGIAEIRLSGTRPPLAGVCDDPRLFVQVAQTARQFATVEEVELYINGVENTGSSNQSGL